MRALLSPSWGAVRRTAVGMILPCSSTNWPAMSSQVQSTAAHRVTEEKERDGGRENKAKCAPMREWTPFAKTSFVHFPLRRGGLGVDNAWSPITGNGTAGRMATKGRIRSVEQKCVLGKWVSERSLRGQSGLSPHTCRGIYRVSSTTSNPFAGRCYRWGFQKTWWYVR